MVQWWKLFGQSQSTEALNDNMVNIRPRRICFHQEKVQLPAITLICSIYVMDIGKICG
jgi:hypothetical protein